MKLKQILNEIMNEMSNELTYSLHPRNSGLWSDLSRVISTVKDDPKSVKIINRKFKTKGFDDILNKYIGSLERSIGTNDHYIGDNVYDVFLRPKTSESVQIKIFRFDKQPVNDNIRKKVDISLKKFCEKYDLILEK